MQSKGEALVVELVEDVLVDLSGHGNADGDLLRHVNDDVSRAFENMFVVVCDVDTRATNKN